MNSPEADLQFALVTPDEDIVNVRVPFPPLQNPHNNLSELIGGMTQWKGYSGSGGPESTDECLNTVVNERHASTRTNPDDPDLCSVAQETELQTGDFLPFRQSARKLVVLITDATPGGFCNNEHTYHAQLYGMNARDKCIRINAILIGNNAAARQVMTEYYYQQSCGWYSELPVDASGLDRAILKMVSTPGYCECQ